MHDDFLLETVRVLAVRGWKPLALGLGISLAMAIPGARLRGIGWSVGILLVAILGLWIALFIGVDSGYRAWQSGPNPPDEAFSDTGGPFSMLFFGCVPATLLLGTVFGLTRRPGGTRLPSPRI